MEKSPRKELDAFANDGSLRILLEGGSPRMSDKAIQLLMDITFRYCQPRKTSSWKRKSK